MSRRLLQRIKLLALPTFFVVSGTSLAPLDEFVISGEYARARAALADCSVAFFPALDERDREPLHFASLIPYMPAGRELRYTYRPLDLSAGTVRDHSPDYEWIETGEGTRWALYESDDGSHVMSMAAHETAQGCTRLYMKIVPPVLQVGLRESTVRSTQSFLDQFADLLPRDYNSTVTLPAVEPGEGEVVVKHYSNGVPVPDSRVFVSTDARGVPGRYGATLGHEHIAHGTSGLAPSILIQGQRSPGRDVELRTDSEGESRFWVRAGYRGGPESVTVRTPEGTGGTTLVSAASVVVRHKEFRHFLFVLGHREKPEPGPDFPFLLTGWTERHYYNHFIDAARARQIASAFHLIWAQDSARAASPTPRYIVLNDMSLEYGGAFKLGAGDACLDPMSGSHHTHDRGVDFDVSPCYSTGPEGLDRVSAGECETGNHLKINERLLAAHIVGRFGGAILVHSPRTDGTPYHYHIRFPATHQ